MQPTDFTAVDQLMREGIQENVFPGAVLLVSKNGRPLFHEAYGKADLGSGGKVTRDTLFDLASLTKPLTTALCVMRLVEDGVLRLDDRVGRLIRSFSDTDKAEVTVAHLLRHTSGLPDYRPYYETLVGRPVHARGALLQKLLVDEARVTAPGQKTRYSDIGFLLLQLVIERIAGENLAALASDRIYALLNLPGLHFPGMSPPFSPERYASTEKCPWRRQTLRGEVHDDNAWAMGGVAGHAGLFGTAEDVWRLSQCLLDAWSGSRIDGFLVPETVRSFLERPDSGERPLGFDVPDPVHPSCGSRFSARTVGHLGFTGTSFWIDPKSALIAVLLTNRVHPSRENQKIQAFRPRVHDAMAEAARR